MTNETVVADPTWLGDIRHFFTAQDKRCMGAYIDLSTYAGVKANHVRIYATTKNKSMPKGAPPWSDERVQTFRNWIDNGFRRGTSGPTSDPFPPAPSRVRIRRNIEELSDDDWGLVRQAFEGLLGRDKSDPNSYC